MSPDKVKQYDLKKELKYKLKKSLNQEINDRRKSSPNPLIK